MKYKWSPVCVFVILIVCACLYLIPSLKMKNSENRTLATFSMIFHPEKDSVVYHDSPVERLDAALSDQFPFREAVVKRYLSLFNASENLTYGLVKAFREEQDDQYAMHRIGKYDLIEDTGYITLCPTTEPLASDIMEKRVEQFDFLHEEYPDLKIYTYYVSQAFDMPWFNDYIGTAAADHYKEICDAVPEYVKSGHLVYRDLADYMDIHYKTDHHWNHRGARRGYEDIYALMSKDIALGDMRVPTDEHRVSDTYGFVYLGSYGRALGELYDGGYDDFYFYEYDIPDRKVSVLDPGLMEEKTVVKLGLYDEYLDGRINKDLNEDHYIKMYGTARDEDGKTYDDDSYPFVIRNSEGNGKNLLVTGDSYDRAVRDVLASHFDTTVYLDYRIISDVPIDQIIEMYDIDILLMSSHTSMWRSEEYLFKFREDK